MFINLLPVWLCSLNNVQVYPTGSLRINSGDENVQKDLFDKEHKKDWKTRGINPIGFIKSSPFQINLVKIVDLKPGVLYGPQDTMWWCWILVKSLQVTHDQKSVFFLDYAWGLYSDTENFFVKY